MFGLRRDISLWLGAACAAGCLAVFFGLWWYLTRGEAEERVYGPLILPSPAETYHEIHDLWVDKHLPANIYVSLRRVVVGFALAILVGVPLGVLCGCFPAIQAFCLPLTIFGRNAPMAALIPLTFALFGATTELQKYMFIFLACVAFVISDTTEAIRDVGSQYIDTAFTLGAGRRQVIFKVLFPLALPTVFNSLRVLFGLAFGYIMLAELVTTAKQVGGLGQIILLAQRHSNQAHILLILMVIPLVALAIDRVLYLVQKQLFPFRYGGRGYLLRCVQWALHGWEDVKRLFFTTAPAGAFSAPRSKSKPAP